MHWIGLYQELKLTDIMILHLFIEMINRGAIRRC